MGEDDLVLAVDGVLGDALARGGRGVLGEELRALRGVQVDRAQRGGGDVDVVDVVEDHGVVRAGDGEVVLLRGR